MKSASSSSRHCPDGRLIEPWHVENGEKVGRAGRSRAFSKDLGPSVFAAETTRMVMLFAEATEPDSPIIFANDSFLSLIAYDPEEVLGKASIFRWQKVRMQSSDRTAHSAIRPEVKASVCHHFHMVQQVNRTPPQASHEWSTALG